jgi:hypothetical protein
MCTFMVCNLLSVPHCILRIGKGLRLKLALLDVLWAWEAWRKGLRRFAGTTGI